MLNQFSYSFSKYFGAGTPLKATSLPARLPTLCFELCRLSSGLAGPKCCPELSEHKKRRGPGRTSVFVVDTKNTRIYSQNNSLLCSV